ncbi:MAG: hypothetical protein HON04_08525, partial [Planctomicrobium sp.]|nr:hypothetical protein [Planctomicrobium sp.]
KPRSIPSPQEESNPALISIEESKSFAEQLRNKKTNNSSRKKTQYRGKGTAYSGILTTTKSRLTAGMFGIVILLMLSFAFKSKTYGVQISIDDPLITLSVDGETLNFDKGTNTFQLSVGAHRLQLQKIGFRTQVENITVFDNRKTKLRVVESDGILGVVSPDDFETPTLAKSHSHKPVAKLNPPSSSESVEKEAGLDHQIDVESVEKQTQASESVMNDSNATGIVLEGIISGTPIDLLRQMSMNCVLDGKVTPHKNGSWVFWNQGLIQLPTNVNKDYRLSVDFEHTSGKSGTVSLLLPVGNSYVEVFTSTTQSEVGTGIQLVSQQKSVDNGTHNPERQFKKYGRVVFSVDVVRLGSEFQVRCLINDQLVAEKRVSENTLSLREPHQNFPRSGIGVECRGESIFVVRKIDLLTDSFRNDSN